jgi:hypothetical protein
MIAEGRVHMLLINALLMEEGAPDLLLEHIAYHELCHVARNHAARSLAGENRFQLEAGAEMCVKRMAGTERYNTYMQAIEAWRPKHPDLQDAQSAAVAGLKLIRDSPHYQ